MAQIIAVTNHKGGLGKTATTFCRGENLRDQGYEVLLGDLDPQGSLSICLGCVNSDKERYTIAGSINMAGVDPMDNMKVIHGIFSYSENQDFIPANWELVSMEMAMGQCKKGEICYE